MIDTFVVNSVDEIDAVAVVLAILSKLRPVTALAGIPVNALPSPLKEPVNEPDKSDSSSLSLPSRIFTLPLVPLLIFILLLPVPISNSDAISLFKLPSLSLISTSPELSLLILVPPMSTVDPAKYISFHLLESLPKSWVVVPSGINDPLNV